MLGTEAVAVGQVGVAVHQGVRSTGLQQGQSGPVIDIKEFCAGFFVGLALRAHTQHAVFTASQWLGEKIALPIGGAGDATEFLVAGVVGAQPVTVAEHDALAAKNQGGRAVSYTHLTLPTIYSV